MKQVTKYRYQVKRNETITIDVTPIQVGPRVTASQNGVVIPNSGPQNGNPRFRFVATEVPGNSHFSVLTCNFAAADPDDARYEFAIGGSNGGGQFKNIPPCKKTHKKHSPEFTFRVVA